MITYSRIIKRTKNIGIRVKPGGLVVVTSPRWVSKKAIEEAILHKELWIKKQIQTMQSLDTKNLLSKYKARSLKLIKLLLDRYNKFYQLNYIKISVRNQSSKWGSCSKSGNLNFNYRFLFLDSELQNYLVVHELCHLKYLNHSPAFWQLVAQTIPNYKILSKKLRNLHPYQVNQRI